MGEEGGNDNGPSSFARIVSIYGTNKRPYVSRGPPPADSFRYARCNCNSRCSNDVMKFTVGLDYKKICSKAYVNHELICNYL